MERYEDWTGGILGTTSCDRCIQLLGGTRFLLLPKPAFPSVCAPHNIGGTETNKTNY